MPMAASRGNGSTSSTSCAALSDGVNGSSSDDRTRLYGRRRGRPLRAGRRRTKDALLPRLAIELPEGGTLDPFGLFPVRPVAVWLEIGFGGGEHLAEQAASHPEI